MSPDPPAERTSLTRTIATGDAAPVPADSGPEANPSAALSAVSAAPPPASAASGGGMSPSQSAVEVADNRRSRLRQHAALALLVVGQFLLFVVVALISRTASIHEGLEVPRLLGQASLGLVWIFLGPGRLRWRVPLGLATWIAVLFLDEYDLTQPAWDSIGNRLKVMQDFLVPGSVDLPFFNMRYLHWRGRLEPLAVFSVVWVVFLILIRLTGYSIVRSIRTSRLRATSYSLRSLLLLTTAGAIAAASAAPARAVISRQFEDADRGQFWNLLHVWLLIASVTYFLLGGLWTWLRPGNPFGRLLAYVAIAVGAGSHLIYVTSAIGGEWEIAAILAGIVLFHCLTWGLLRLAGFRLLSRKERAPALLGAANHPPDVHPIKLAEPAARCGG